jgi:hypothetical protein
MRLRCIYSHTKTNTYINLSIYLCLYSPCGPWPLFHFLNLYTVSRTPRTGDQPVARLLPTYRITQTEYKRTDSYMPQVGFEPMIPVFERAKTVHALDRAATVIGKKKYIALIICFINTSSTTCFSFTKKNHNLDN